MSVANLANLVAVIGSSGSGKSLWVKTVALPALRRPVLIFDPMREYAGGVCASLSVMVKELRLSSHAADAGVLIYRPNKMRELEKQFETFCGIALAVKNCSLIVEELSLVTKAGYSPPRWREVVTTGRHYGLSVIGTTQRPALVDKTFFSNATMVRVGRLNAAGDKKTMADALDISADRLRELRPLDWLQKDMQTGALTSETLTPPGAKSRRKSRA